jgi:hypothetical protein
MIFRGMNKQTYYYILTVAHIFLLNYVYNNNVNNDITIGNMIKKFEELRENIDTSNTCLGFLLSIIPNKYHHYSTLFDYSYTSQYFERKRVYHAYITAKSNIHQGYGGGGLCTNCTNIDKFNEISFENLRYFGIDCYTPLSINSLFEWCQEPFIFSEQTKPNECIPADYYSGFYNAREPSLNIGILRKPSDLGTVINALHNNIYKNKLNVSNYKLSTEKDIFKIAIIKAGMITDEKTGIISTNKLNLILTEDDTYDNSYDANKKSKLIWKALNYSGYDVPPEWFIVDLGRDNTEYTKFNKFVINLSENVNWVNNAVKHLLNTNSIENAEQYKMSQYRSYSQPQSGGYYKYKTIKKTYFKLLTL